MTTTAMTQRRTVATLAGSQVLGGVGVSAGTAVGALLAADVSGSEAWAGLGGTAQTLGGALSAVVLARIMAAKG
ncbi:MAG: MFS transporter, partial [Nocardioidaceae bacterium]|nr:MFS transporter [Nocardioidaceae bacterium]